MAALERLGGLPARASQQVGVDPDAREALVFAVLGARLVAGEPVTRATVTGAREGRILGILVPGPAVG
jgi:1,6-anhydro-N-acetylmuramate kinase